MPGRDFIGKPSEPEEIGCSRKAAYASRREARTMANKARTIDGVKPYRCEWCQLWHLGHQRSRKTRRHG